MRRNLVKPSPSQPRSRVIKLGKNTSIFIDRTNNPTRALNRLTVLSAAIYDSENIRTLDAMSKTVRETRVPVGSIIIGKEIDVELKFKISQ